jgi:hypothetical protein
MADLADFVARVNSSKIIPKDPYSHNANLIDTDEKIIPEYNKVVGKHHLLSNVGDDVTLRLYQNDSLLLSWLLSMAKRDKSLIPVYDVLAGVFLSELNLTRAKDGGERKEQANAASGYSNLPANASSGYGAELQKRIQELQNQDTTLINDLLNRGKK